MFFFLLESVERFKETYSPLILMKNKLNFQKMIIYYNKLKTSNLTISYNFSLLIGVLQKNYVIYQFNCLLGDCISENNNIYVCFTSTTLSRRLTMHLWYQLHSQTSKKHLCPASEFWKILTKNTILEWQNNQKKTWDPWGTTH